VIRVILLSLIVSSVAFGADREITWTHSGKSVTHFKLYGNPKGSDSLSYLGQVPGEERKYMLVVPDDCSPYYVMVQSCNETQCSTFPSNIHEYRASCPETEPAILGE